MGGPGLPPPRVTSSAAARCHSPTRLGNGGSSCVTHLAFSSARHICLSGYAKTSTRLQVQEHRLLSSLWFPHGLALDLTHRRGGHVPRTTGRCPQGAAGHGSLLRFTQSSSRQPQSPPPRPPEAHAPRPAVSSSLLPSFECRPWSGQPTYRANRTAACGSL